MKPLIFSRLPIPFITFSMSQINKNQENNNLTYALSYKTGHKLTLTPYIYVTKLESAPFSVTPHKNER